MDLKYHIGGDGDFRAMDQAVAKINQVQKAEEQLAKHAAAQAAMQRELVQLKQQHVALLTKAQQLSAAGNASGAAQATAQAAQLQRTIGLLQSQAAAAQTAARATQAHGKAAGGIARDLDSAATSLASFARSQLALVAAAFGFRAITAHAGNVADLAEQLELTSEEVIRNGAAFQDAGLSVGAFASAMDRVGMARRAAAEGNEKFINSFERMGISAEALNDPLTRNYDLFLKIAAASSVGGNRAFLNDILGKRGARFAAAFDAIQRPAEGLPTNSEVRAADEVGKGLERAARWARDAGTALLGQGWMLLRDISKNGFGAAWGSGIVNFFRRREMPASGPSETERAASAYAREQAEVVAGTRRGEDMSPEAKQYQKALELQAELKRKADAAQQQASNGAGIADAVERTRLAENAFAEIERRRQATPETNWSQADRAAYAAARKAVHDARSGVETTNQAAQAAGSQAANARAEAGGPMDVLFNRAGGALFENEAAKIMAAANAKAREGLEMNLLSVTEKRARLETQIAEMRDRQSKTADAMGKERIESEILEKQGQLQALGKPDAGYAISVGALQRIGGFTGGVGGHDPVQTGLAALRAEASGNRRASEEILRRLGEGLDVRFSD